MKLLRTLHIYVSMFGLLLLLFFAATGFTLNHAAWFGLDQPQSSTVTGKLDPSLLSAPDKFTITEELRRQLNLPGLVAAFDLTDDECLVDFKRPGGSARAVINRSTGDVTATIDSYGAMAVLHDLHMGRDSGRGWSMVVDLSAWLMIFVSISGLVLLFSLRKRRGLGTVAMLIGAGMAVVAYVWLVP